LPNLNSNIWKLYFVVLKGVYYETSNLVWVTGVLTGFFSLSRSLCQFLPSYCVLYNLQLHWEKWLRW